MNRYLRKPFKTMEVNLIWKKETIFLYIISPGLKKGTGRFMLYLQVLQIMCDSFSKSLSLTAKNTLFMYM